VVQSPARFPLDLQQVSYSYLERPNEVLLSLLDRYVLHDNTEARILDVGCGAGANARAIRGRHPQVRLIGVEPNEHAAHLAREVFHHLHHGDAASYLAGAGGDAFDAIVLSDVLEHVPDPVLFLRELVGAPALRNASWIISVPNYGVWYNRLRTLAGSFDYGWSGLYDRTHLRFYTRRTIGELLRYVGLQVQADSCTPSLVQSMAPVLRKMFDKNVDQGEHLSLGESKLFQLYSRFVEPTEARVCQAWPELLGFQVVTVARSVSAAR
jgi:SAM-dependent methyltransferase